MESLQDNVMLYHAITGRAMDSILKNGLVPGLDGYTYLAMFDDDAYGFVVPGKIIEISFPGTDVRVNDHFVVLRIDFSDLSWGQMQEMTSSFPRENTQFYAYPKVIPPDQILTRKDIHLNVAVEPMELLIGAIRKAPDFDFTPQFDNVIDDLKIIVLKDGFRFATYSHSFPHLIELSTGDVMPIDQFVRFIAS